MALLKARFASGLLPLSYVTRWDTTPQPARRRSSASAKVAAGRWFARAGGRFGAPRFIAYPDSQGVARARDRFARHARRLCRARRPRNRLRRALRRMSPQRPRQPVDASSKERAHAPCSRAPPRKSRALSECGVGPHPSGRVGGKGRLYSYSNIVLLIRRPP